MDSKIKIYVGYSLTQSPQLFKTQIEGLKNSLRQEYEVLDFVGISEGTASQVYNHDINTCVATCDLLLAVCDYPALGLGYELGAAIEKYNKPVLAVAHEHATVARLILGIDNAGFTFERYKDLADVPRLVQKKLMMIAKHAMAAALTN